jgi:hypothetical protein
MTKNPSKYKIYFEIKWEQMKSALRVLKPKKTKMPIRILFHVTS